MLASHTRTLFFQMFGHPPVALDLFRLRGPLICYDGHLSLEGGPFSFIRTPSGLFSSLALRMRTILPRADHFLLLAQHAWRVAYQMYGPQSACRTRTFFVHANLLSVMGGPRSLARGPFLFIRTPEWTFLLTQAWGTDHFLPRALRARTFILIFHVRARIFCHSRADARCASRADARSARGPFPLFPQGGGAAILRLPHRPPPLNIVTDTDAQKL